MVNDTALVMTPSDFNHVKNTNASNNNNNATIPQAVLVYHESAHSIVFRDGLHSQQGAIRKQRTASFSSSSVQESRGMTANKKTLTRGYSMGADCPNNRDCYGNDDGYLSSSPKNNSSLRPLLYRHSSMPVGSSSSTHTPQASVAVNYQEEGYESSDSSTAASSSSASIGSFYCGKGGKVHSKPNNNKANTKPANNTQQQPQPTIVIANFQPIIEPLEPLHLHSSNIYEPLLHATPEQILQHFDEQGDDGKDNDDQEKNCNNCSKRGGGEMLTEYECEVIEMLKQEKAVVKTIRNSDWTTFIQKFIPVNNNSNNDNNEEKVKVGDNDDNGNISTRMAMGKRTPHPAERKEQHNNSIFQSPPPTMYYNSFITSTSLLPSSGKKMRCFGSTSDYTVGVVFALPTTFTQPPTQQQQQHHDHHHHHNNINEDTSSNNNESVLEDEAARRTLTWSWPSGYSAKTEYNINENGNLINGRYEALVSISTLRQLNHTYLFDTNYIVGGRLINGGLTTVPYNEVYVRVGGLGRIVNGIDISSGTRCAAHRTYYTGLGLPVALFIRDASFGSIVRLLRTRARYSAILGVDAARDIPLLLITPELGVCVFTRRLQQQVLKVMAQDLNPFQNSALAHFTSIDNTSEAHLQQKLEELLDINDDNIKGVLTPEELARIAGGFGATDESVANLLYQAVQRDRKSGGDEEKSNTSSLQDIVNEGLAFSLRANDYHTSRQLLILYTLVSAKCHDEECKSKKILLDEITDEGYQSESSLGSSSCPRGTIRWRDAEKNIVKKGGVVKRLLQDEILLQQENSPPPPPPPLDTDRLRSATNSDGLLAVLGAAQVLRAMQEQSAKRRVNECIDALDK